MAWYSIQHCSDWDWTYINKLTDHYLHQLIHITHPISNPYGKTVRCLFPDSKAHRANMGPTWVLLAPDGHHVGPMNLAIRVVRIWKTIDRIIRTLHCFRCTLWTAVVHPLFTVAIGCLANVKINVVVYSLGKFGLQYGLFFLVCLKCLDATKPAVLQFTMFYKLPWRQVTSSWGSLIHYSSAATVVTLGRNNYFILHEGWQQYDTFDHIIIG